MTFRSRWVLPIDQPPIRHGWIEVDDGRIARLGGGVPPSAEQVRDLGDVLLLPGLVNTHTHLELSWMAGHVPPAESLPVWIRRVLELRAAGPHGGEAVALDAARAAARAMRATGTVLVGDVSNEFWTPAVLREAGLGGVVFHELIGFNAVDSERLVHEAWARVDRAALHPPLDASVVVHAPYSASPALVRAVARQRREAPLAIHLAESSEEGTFLRTGRGPFRDLLESLAVWTGDWEVPHCGPVEYLQRLGYLRPGLLAVHGVHLSDAELDRLRSAGAVLVSCPRSNAWVGAGLPRLTHAYAAHVPVAYGTDSLASARSLNLFDELAEARRIAPDIAAAALLDSATRAGAAALGFEAWYGTLSPGKRAEFTMVNVPRGVEDVEEYLVSGIPPSEVQPLSA